ncbi:TetR/AcrR family transcriptional regulator [Curtobacterium sp. MCSS17_015]|uniref:TetR/AcrR family transcriptional regulator n=1 Tax=Curtobacterium sp. MCSS17_015 TaxID=2175666 RepID=UPI000DA9D729|nr:TetR/AcrR family transcriptional regulator [Curtobacterium sp. MCSS17_015]WIB26846.1 TetR/AcrR family transcriptional regulator [Curtobacterium sp. MCSS17_015]
MVDGTSNDQTPTSAGGRPRDPLIEEAIIQSTRALLATKGYSSMTIRDIVEHAGVTRPTLYRRWPNKYELVVEALQYGLRKQREAYPPLNLDDFTPREAMVEAVRRLDPRFHNPRAMSLHGNFMAEAEREPGLLAQMREHGNQPRCQELADVLTQLQERGAVRKDVDIDIIVSLAFGSYFADFNRYGHDVPADFAERVVATLWPLLAEEHGRASG